MAFQKTCRNRSSASRVPHKQVGRSVCRQIRAVDKVGMWFLFPYGFGPQYTLAQLPSCGQLATPVAIRVTWEPSAFIVKMSKVPKLSGLTFELRRSLVKTILVPSG